MRHPRLIILLLFLTSCSNPQRSVTDASGSDSGATRSAYRTDNTFQTDSGSVIISCDGIGPVKLSHTLEELELITGKENIQQDSLFLEGNFEGLVTALWKGTPKEIIVHWKQRMPPFEDIKMLELNGTESLYRFSNGIKTGSQLREIVRLNDQPLTIYGFGWDYGGTFVSFNNGKLAKEIPCFGGVFELQYTGKFTDDLTPITGDHQIRSEEPALLKYGARLSKIRINNKERD